MRHVRVVSIIIFFFIFISPVHSSLTDELIGITWCDNKLVSFDPDTGTVRKTFIDLDKNECFRGLAYDPKHNMLYALAQGSRNLYSINPEKLWKKLKLIGRLDIDEDASWGEDIGGLTYDPSSGTFYTAVAHWDSGSEDVWSEIVAFTLKKGRNKKITVRRIGRKKNNMYINSLSFNKEDKKIYAFTVEKSGSWDSAYKSRLVSINPANADITLISQTPYHTITGLALKPVQKPGKKSSRQQDSFIFYSWVNWKSHTYARVELEKDNNKIIMTKPIRILGGSDAVGVASEAMLYKDFEFGLKGKKK